MADKSSILKVPPKAPPKKKGPGFFSRIGKYFRDVKAELKKVVWPTRKQVINNTIVVFVTVLAFGVVVWSLDFVLSFVRDLLINSF